MDPAVVEHLRQGVLGLILIIVSIGLHEFGHAWVADLRGDPLPRAQGRVSLNPFVHADPIGTILIPAVMIFLSPGVGLIGWGKPVQVALLNPRTRRADAPHFLCVAHYRRGQTQKTQSPQTHRLDHWRWHRTGAMECL